MTTPFDLRECPTGEHTSETLASLSPLKPGSLLGSFFVTAAPPPFGEAARMPLTPPSVGSWTPVYEGVFDETEADQIGTCFEDNPSEDPEENSWDRRELTEDDYGLILNMITRVVYKIESEGGDEVLYGFCRSLAFDTAGKLVYVSEEERVTIDTPEECVPEPEESD